MLAAALIRPSVEPSVFVKSLHSHIKLLGFFYLHCPPNDIISIARDSLQSGPFAHTRKVSTSSSPSQDAPRSYPPVPPEERQPIRVLGLFDGIATGEVQSGAITPLL